MPSDAKPYAQFRDIPQFTRARYAVDIPLDYLERWIENNEPDFDPPFQRAHVWTDEQRSRFIEFILRGGTSGGNIYFNHPGWFRSWKGTMVVVDGKQRITACLMFLRNEIPAFGRMRSEYSGRIGLMMMQLRFHVHDFEDPADVLRWYLELNDGGTPHTPEEIERVRVLLAEAEGGSGHE